ncbi:MAG: hypothetical protein AAF721_42425 [Myxococcota bacterium]
MPLVVHMQTRELGGAPRCALAAVSALLLSFGCSGEDGAYPFGAGMGPQATSAAPLTSSDSSGPDGESAADDSPTSGTTMAVDGPDDGDPDTTGGAAATSTAASTMGGASDSTGSMGDTSSQTTDGTTGPASGTTEDGGMGNPGVQPNAGMYSECSQFDACPPLIDPICLSTGPLFGFCTIECNASNQCDPPPGETTTAVCDPALGYCMLDCSAGSCPTGLDCVVGDLGAGVVSRCLEQ